MLETNLLAVEPSESILGLKMVWTFPQHDQMYIIFSIGRSILRNLVRP